MVHYCSDSEVGSQAPGAKMRSPDFVVRFSLYGTWDNSTYGSAAASKGCSFVNYFCKQGFAISTLPPRVLRTNCATAGLARGSHKKVLNTT